MPKDINKIIKKLPKAQQARIDARAKELIKEAQAGPEETGTADRLADEATARGLGPVVNVGDIQVPRYVTIKKVIEVEETWTVLKSDLWSDQLQARLEMGDVNMVQVATVESYVWVVDKTGARVALLQKDGGCGPNEKLTVEVL